MYIFSKTVPFYYSRHKISFGMVPNHMNNASNVIKPEQTHDRYISKTHNNIHYTAQHYLFCRRRLLCCMIFTQSWRSSTKVSNSLVFSSGLRSSTSSDRFMMLLPLHTDEVLRAPSLSSDEYPLLLLQTLSPLVERYR